MAEAGATKDGPAESLEGFLQSFAYGSRNDLLFKFLHTRNGLKERGGAEFFRKLLELLGEAFDTGDYSRVLEHCVSAQIEGYTPAPAGKALVRVPAGAYLHGRSVRRGR